jgi:hypothetical protein
MVMSICLNTTTAQVPLGRRPTPQSSKALARLEVILAQFVIDGVEANNKAIGINNSYDPLWREANSLLEDRNLDMLNLELLRFDGKTEQLRAKQFLHLLSDIHKGLTTERQGQLRQEIALGHTPAPKRLPWLICKILGC